MGVKEENKEVCSFGTSAEEYYIVLIFLSRRIHGQTTRVLFFLSFLSSSNFWLSRYYCMLIKLQRKICLTRESKGVVLLNISWM
jgi:hypothetical protein